MLDFARSLTVASAGRYLLWRARGRPGPIVLRTRAGPRFELPEFECADASCMCPAPPVYSSQ